MASDSTNFGAASCCWTSAAPAAGFERIERNEAADVVVVGGGICGLTAALKLAEEGRSVVVLEARQVGRQVTGRSTGKVTLQHRLIYAELVETYGRALAKAYADANQEGLQFIVERSRRFDVDCDLRRAPAYVYGCAAKSSKEFEREASAAKHLGLAQEVLESAPVPFATSGALRFPDQAQFNPALYLVGLARAVVLAGGRIYERSRASGFESDGRWIVDVSGTRVTARNLVMATHVPVKSPKGYATRVRPRCHVAMAFRAKSESDVPGMFIGVE